MDTNRHQTMEKQAISAVAALRKNRFDAHYLKTPEQLLKSIRELMPSGSTCSVGGSVTLAETGVRQLLEEGPYTYYDRYAPGAVLEEVFAQALGCDYYFMSSNAVIADGRLYNVDGGGNRVAALSWGPKRVVVVAGSNKIVGSLDAARERVRNLAAPANAIRLDRGTPCSATGFCGDCASPGRICSQELVSGWQCKPGRVSVFLLAGCYGY